MSANSSVGCRSPPPPPPSSDEQQFLRTDDDQELRPQTPVMGSSRAADEHTRTKEASETSIGGGVIYTPASTVSSSAHEEEGSAEPTEGDSAVWGEWWKAEELAAQVGSLSKELTEMKEIISRQTVDGEVNDVSRLKANHRSSLASLAQLHRSEVAGLNASHAELMKKLELQHMEELRSARRSTGHDRDLIQGLHESYSRQIESLVLDLGEARRELKEVKLKQPLPAAEGTFTSVVRDNIDRTLSLKLTFENLPAHLSTTQLSILHPGQTFTALLRVLSFTVKNHLQVVNNTANFFLSRPREEHVEAAVRIRHWYNSALEEKVHFSFDCGASSDNSSMKDRWERYMWKDDDCVLGVLCTAESWEEMPAYFPELEAMMPGCGSSLESPAEKLLSVESPRSSTFNTAAELERINRELGNLQLHQQLQEQADRELQDYEEDKENHEPTPKHFQATVESVQDEDEPAESVKSIPILRMPRPPACGPDPDTCTTGVPLIWEDDQADTPDPTPSVSLEQGLKEILEKGARKAKMPEKTLRSSESWLLDEIFSPFTGEQDKDAEGKSDGVSTLPKDITDEVNSKMPQSFIDPLLYKEDGSGRHPGFGWRWLLTSDGVVKTPTDFAAGVPSPLEVGGRAATFPGRASAAGSRPRSGVYSGGTPAAESHQGQYNAEHPLFDFAEARSSPAPPPAPLAPEASAKDSPTLPAYSQADIGTTHDLGESAHGNDSNPGMATDSENPFAELKSAPCDSPAMNMAHSVISSTPLLDDDAETRRSDRSRAKRSYNSNNGEQRMPAPPFAPSTGSQRGPGSPESSKYSASRYNGYLRSEDQNETSNPEEPWENGSQSSGSEEWRSQSAPDRKQHTYGANGESYTWNRNADRDGYRPRSVSPAPSRSTIATTTDQRSERILPPNIYPHTFPNSNASAIPAYRYGMRPVSMGPLGPPNRVPAFANPQHADIVFQQQMKRFEEMFSGTTSNFGPVSNFGGPTRSNTAPSFSGGPVFAPNPPHSIAASRGVGGGVPVPSAYGNNPRPGEGSLVPRYPFEQNWPVHQSRMMQSQVPHRVFPAPSSGEHQRQSFSPDSISPLLWGTQNPMASEQMQVGHSPAVSNHAHEQQQFAGMQMYPGTPNSHQGWFQGQPFDVGWNGSPVPLPLRMPMHWAQGGYSA